MLLTAAGRRFAEEAAEWRRHAAQPQLSTGDDIDEEDDDDLSDDEQTFEPDDEFDEEDFDDDFDEDFEEDFDEIELPGDGKSAAVQDADEVEDVDEEISDEDL